jgi:hypothetical protein
VKHVGKSYGSSQRKQIQLTFEHVGSNALRIPSAINLQSSLPPSLHGPSRIWRGVVLYQFHQTEGGAPFLKKKRELQKENRAREASSNRRKPDTKRNR